MNFSNGKELLFLCEKHKMKIHEVMIEREKTISNITENELRHKMSISLNVMKRSVHKALNEEVKSVGGLIGGDAKRIYDRAKTSKPICGQLMSKAISSAMAVLEVNASMGKIVASPTAGSCGIIPGVLLTISEEFRINDKELINTLIAASAIGMIITKNATVSGAEGGCQAETGSAAAMASGAIVELMGDTPSTSLEGAAICLKNILGLICDPIAGLVEAPCEKRNAIGAANALISAEMALAGVKSIIPFDEVVDAMYKVGRSIPYELRETALGGLASTPTGIDLMGKILRNSSFSSSFPTKEY